MSLTTSTTTSEFFATSRDTASSIIGVYQQTIIGFSDISIRILVPDPISADPYRKALIFNPLFRQIITLSDIPSVSFSDLMLTVTSYFSLNTESAERETKATSISIHNIFFFVSNLQGVFEFSLRLPQSLIISFSSSTLLLNASADSSAVTTFPQPVEDLNFKLGNISDEILSEMGVDQMRTLLMDARDALSSAVPSSAVSVQYTTLFSTS